MQQKAAVGEIYHVFTKSIAGYVIFNNTREYLRMVETISYYRQLRPPVSYSQLMRPRKTDTRRKRKTEEPDDFERRVEIIAYCLMPTHLHLILLQKTENGVAKFMSDCLNSYVRYFNIRHKRKGPLWQGRYKKVHVESDTQLLHLTRYLHLNPVTEKLVDQAGKWPASSYGEYIAPGEKEGLCEFKDLIEVQPKAYAEFISERISYQRKLKEIRELIME